jgi:hypothetical protein
MSMRYIGGTSKVRERDRKDRVVKRIIMGFSEWRFIVVGWGYLFI